MLYLAIFSIIFLLIFIVNGCSYPTNYKAFVPKALDSDYKEYQRLCKEEIGKVIYARPVGEGVKLEDLSGIPLFGFPLNNAIKLNAIGVRDKSDKNKDEIKIIYIVIVGFEYYNSWVTPSLSMHQDVKQYIQCRPLLYGKDWDEEYAIIEKKLLKIKNI